MFSLNLSLNAVICLPSAPFSLSCAILASISSFFLAIISCALVSACAACTLRPVAFFIVFWILGLLNKKSTIILVSSAASCIWSSVNSTAPFTCSSSSPINSSPSFSFSLLGSPIFMISSSISLKLASISLPKVSISISIPKSSSVAGSSLTLASFSGPCSAFFISAASSTSSSSSDSSLSVAASLSSTSASSSDSSSSSLSVESSLSSTSSSSSSGILASSSSFSKNSEYDLIDWYSKIEIIRVSSLYA